jgi:hypothetical protein
MITIFSMHAVRRLITSFTPWPSIREFSAANENSRSCVDWRFPPIHSGQTHNIWDLVAFGEHCGVTITQTGAIICFSSVLVCGRLLLRPLIIIAFIPRINSWIKSIALGKSGEVRKLISWELCLHVFSRPNHCQFAMGSLNCSKSTSLKELTR